MASPDFITVKNSIAYLVPGLHSDAFDDTDSGWSRQLRLFAAEAWRRAGNRQISDIELYPEVAAWTGIYGRMPKKTKDAIGAVPRWRGKV